MDKQPTRKCCVCFAHNWKFLFKAQDKMHSLPGSWGVWRCHCGTQITHPIPQNMDEYYPQNYYTYQIPRQPTPPALLKRWYQAQANFKPLALFMRLVYGPGPIPMFREYGKVFDIGCGSGQWLAKMAALDWEVAGVEPSYQAVEAANQAGLNVQQGTIETVTYPDQSFDVVRIWHVLEHVEDPLNLLHAAYRLLKPSGQLILGVPNSAGLLARLAGPYWFDLDAPRHRWHWNPIGLRVLIERAGFSDVQVGFGYYGGLPSVRSWGYAWSKQRSSTWQTIVKQLRKIIPLHGIWASIEWNNYIELEAYRD